MSDKSFWSILLMLIPQTGFGEIKKGIFSDLTGEKNGDNGTNPTHELQKKRLEAISVATCIFWMVVHKIIVPWFSR
ncbi:hypothetical protein CEXT_225851 [Caerostris extrusa]|uniref:Uncharacterized protein n=1 Tax=Caerostris extrusa TaxID=172846 RepID=A0AAV4UPJ4_CAEEX|nr:hypothetical protein CEXT_225851 [Caerostris extrusa]